MFLRLASRRCRAAASGVAASTTSVSSSNATLEAASTQPSRPQQSSTAPSFHSWLHEYAGLDAAKLGVAFAPSKNDARGLVARRHFRTGVTVLSLPMNPFAITSETLQRSPIVVAASPPTFDEVRREMHLQSVRDPVLHQQMYLAVLLAAERVSRHSPLLPYFELLPHPAVDDAAVMRLHKDVLDPLQLIEWDDHQRIFVTMCRRLSESWARRVRGGTKPLGGGESIQGAMTSPPAEVIYWAFRTVLSRMHLLPDRSAEARSQERNSDGAFTGSPTTDSTAATNRPPSALNYSAYSALAQVGEQESFLRRTVGMLTAAITSRQPATPFRLVPTLVPGIDMAVHLSSGNVSVEVQPRPGLGSCVELQAVTEIREGEPIGMSLNRSQGAAFSLYRFGFLPI